MLVRVPSGVHMARWVILGTFENVVGVPNGGGQEYPTGNEFKGDQRTVVLVLAGMPGSAPLQDDHSAIAKNGPKIE